MHRRLIAILVLLATLLQGPVLAYGAALESGGNAASHVCPDYTRADSKDCDACCTHGSMPSCVVQCQAAVGAAAPLSLPTSLRIAIRRTLIPDTGVAPFADHSPPHPLRPPIV